MADKLPGYAVDPAKRKFSGETVDAVAVVDNLGYTDLDGFPRYVPRGTEVTLPEEEWERLAVRSEDAMAKGNFPAVVKPGHPHLDHLTKAVSAAEHPEVARLKLMQAHGMETGLLTPAGEPVAAESTLPAPAPVGEGGFGVDFGSLKTDSLKDIAKAAGIDTKGMKKDDLVAALSARQAAAGVTPRVGAASPETGAGDAEDAS